MEFTGEQARRASDEWAECLEAQGAAVAGAWAHTEEARIPPYRFAALSLIAECQRNGLRYHYQFSPEETRQTLLENSIPEEILSM